MPHKRALIKHIDTVSILGAHSNEAIAKTLNHDCTQRGLGYVAAPQKYKKTKKMQYIFNNSLHFAPTPKIKNSLCGHALTHNALPYRGIFHVGDRGKMQ